MALRSLLSLLLVAAANHVAANTGSKFTLRSETTPSPHWQNLGPPPSTHLINLRIGLTLSNFDALETHLYEVSDPSHGRYGQWLGKEEVNELIRPGEESVSEVERWLKEFGVEKEKGDCSWNDGGDWVSVRVPVEVAERMLNTTYYTWRHALTGDTLVRATSYSLPSHLDTHISTVQPTNMFAQFKKFKSTIHSIESTSDGSTSVVEHDLVQHLQSQTVTASTGAVVNASCNSSITLECLRELYNIGNYTPSANVGNSVGITGYLEEFANAADLQLFYAAQLPQAAAVNSSFGVILLNNGTNPQDPADAGVEANLDVQYAFGLSFPVNATFYSTGGSPPFIPDDDTPTDTNEPYLNWLDFVLAQPNPPKTISTSYGDDEQTVPKDFAIRVCQDFAKLSARGVSLMFSSGDGGVGDGDPDPTTQTCFTNDGKNLTKFIPGFPASCPFVTAVGATFQINETAVSFSGGGFSNYFARPAYQEKAVTGFFKTIPKDLYQGLFNRNGRAIPDVAAQGVRFQVFIGGALHLVSGTSASSPAFAGIVALLNDVRLRKRLPPLGFLNPLFYSDSGKGFNDIVTGNNPGCGTAGFNATVGWDPVTGFGTPDFAVLSKIVAAPFFR